MTTRINVWSSPRNISTAFMYSFAQRPDTIVVDEPLYAHYLKRSPTEAEHPGTAEILNSQANEATDVIRDVLLADYPSPVALFKQMTHHLIDMDWSFMQNMQNVMLIRDPRAIIYSYAKVIPNPVIEDIGVKKQLELFNYLKKQSCLNAVIETSALLKNPEGVLRQLCERLSIPFTGKMLHWEAGARPEDGVWAKYWYTNVHQSTGFLPWKAKEYPLTAQQEELASECRPYFESLLPYSLKGL